MLEIMPVSKQYLGSEDTHGKLNYELLKASGDVLSHMTQTHYYPYDSNHYYLILNKRKRRLFG